MTMTPHHHCTPVLLCGDDVNQGLHTSKVLKKLGSIAGLSLQSLRRSPSASSREWQVLKTGVPLLRCWGQTGNHVGERKHISNICKFSECPMWASCRQLSSPVPILSPSEINAKPSHRNEDFIYQTRGFLINTQNEGLSAKEDVAGFMVFSAILSLQVARFRGAGRPRRSQGALVATSTGECALCGWRHGRPGTLDVRIQRGKPELSCCHSKKSTVIIYLFIDLSI